LDQKFQEEKNSGIIVRIVGVVVDVEFASGKLPSIYNALLVLTLAVCKKKNAPIEPKIVQLERKYFFQKSISVI